MNFKLWQKDYKLEQGFQIGAKRFQVGAEITNRGKRDLKSGQGLQIGAVQMASKLLTFNINTVFSLEHGFRMLFIYKFDSYQFRCVVCISF